ncbi:hypothetical protein ColKHC_08780 [Colletotrichum higginsianum]|nr:hypothetical protein ColKHC_08780 [Colletotrichum higginsianum]
MPTTRSSSPLISSMTRFAASLSRTISPSNPLFSTLRSLIPSCAARNLSFTRSTSSLSSVTRASRTASAAPPRRVTSPTSFVLAASASSSRLRSDRPSAVASDSFASSFAIASSLARNTRRPTSTCASRVAIASRFSASIRPTTPSSSPRSRTYPATAPLSRSTPTSSSATRSLSLELAHGRDTRAELLPQRQLELVVLVDGRLVHPGAPGEVPQPRQEEVEDLAAVRGQRERDLAGREVLELQAGGAQRRGEGGDDLGRVGAGEAQRAEGRVEVNEGRRATVRRRAATCDSIVAKGSAEVSSGVTDESFSDRRSDSRVPVSFETSRRSDATSSSSRRFSGSGRSACTPASDSGWASPALLRDEGVDGPAATGLVSGGVRKDDRTREGVLQTISAIVASPKTVSSPICTTPRSPHTDSASTVSVSMKSSAKGSRAASPGAQGLDLLLEGPDALGVEDDGGVLQLVDLGVLLAEVAAQALNLGLGVLGGAAALGGNSVHLLAEPVAADASLDAAREDLAEGQEVDLAAGGSVVGRGAAPPLAEGVVERRRELDGVWRPRDARLIMGVRPVEEEEARVVVRGVEAEGPGSEKRTRRFGVFLWAACDATGGGGGGCVDEAAVAVVPGKLRRVRRSAMGRSSLGIVKEPDVLDNKVGSD